MIFYFVVLLVLSLISGKIKKNEDVLSIEATQCINGIFVLIIFLGHATQYFLLDEMAIGNKIFSFLMYQIGQLCVTSFLFFSGYGIFESIKSKNKYIESMPKNRILITLINFDIAIILYFIVNRFLNIDYDLGIYIGALIGVTSVGNSNWYIFTILSMYILTYLIGKFVEKNKLPWLQMEGTIMFIIILKYCLDFPSRFYSTVLCYPLGMIFSLNKDKIIPSIKKYKWITLLGTIALFIILVIMGIRKTNFGYNIYSCLFMAIVIILMCVIRVDSIILRFLGVHCFSIYILQRIPMIILSSLTNIANYPVFFTGISLVITLLISLLFDMMIGLVDEKIRRI